MKPKLQKHINAERRLSLWNRTLYFLLAVAICIASRLWVLVDRYKPAYDMLHAVEKGHR
jgi:hypothetical protein